MFITIMYDDVRYKLIGVCFSNNSVYIITNREDALNCGRKMPDACYAVHPYELHAQTEGQLVGYMVTFLFDVDF
jgi:hypothetical protein